MKNLYVRLSANVGEFRQQMHAAGASTREFGQQMETASKTSRQHMDRVGKSAMIAGGLIVAGLAAAVASAAQFETSMRNANSIMHQSEAEFRATSAAVLDMSRRLPQSATNLANGLYDIASSGFQGADGLKILHAAAVSATAGMSDTATAARAITGVLNAYGMEADDAAHVSDVLFQTVNVGVLTFEELAQNVGDYTSTAAALGVSVEETSAALATMTLAGINAAESSTALNRVLSSFIKPTDAMSAALRGMGYESGTAAVEALGLKGAVEAVDRASGGSVQSIAEMYGEVRAIKGALALTAAEGENYADSTDAIATASDGAGAAQEAYNEQSKAFSVQLSQAKNSVNALAIEIGTRFLPMLSSGAKVVGNVADALASLPGPIQSVVIGATALAGVIALTGGAALVAVPRMVAYQTSIATIGTTAPRVATALRLLNASVLGLGVFATAAAAVGALNIGFDFLGRKIKESLHDAPPEVDALTRSLDILAVKGDLSGAVAQEFGKNLGGLHDALSAMAKDDRIGGNLMTGGFLDRATGLLFDNPHIEDAKDSLKNLNSAFKDLFAHDPEAATRAWGQLAAQWEAAGYDVADLIVALPEVTAGLDANADAGDKAKAEMELLTAEAQSLGINLDATSELLNMTAEDMAKLKGATEPVIFGMLEAGTVTKEQAEQMQSDLEAFVDAVRSTFADATAPLSIYVAEVQRVNDEARDAWDKGHDSMEGFTEASSISLGQFVTAMATTVEDTQKFADGITEAIDRGYDPELIAQLLTAGPKDAGPILDTLLADHSATAVAQVNMTVAALRAINTQAVEMARLLHLATTSETDAMADDLDEAMGIAQQKAKLGGKATAMAIAQEMGLAIPEVRRIAKEFGIAIQEGVESAHPQIIVTVRSSGGQAVRYQAAGGIDPPHVAQFAPAGAMRVWAEPETGGEAYIPLSRSKRGRSRSIWRETGRLLGMASGGVLAFAEGGGFTQAVSDVRFRGALEGVGQSLAGRAGYGADDLAQIGRAYADLAVSVDEATARMLLAQGLTAQGYQDAAAQIIASLESREERERRAAEATSIMYAEGRLSGDEYVAALRAQHDQVAAEFGYWSSEAQALRATITTVMDDMAQRTADAEDVMYAEGRTSGDDYIALLKERHAKIAEQYGYWSQEALAIRDEIRGIEADMATDAQAATDEMVAVWERANDRFEQQQAEYDRLVAENRARTVDALAGVWESARRRYEQQAADYQAALEKRQRAVADAIQSFHDSITGPVHAAGDLIANFGRPGQLAGGSDEIVAMLEHRVEATHRWQDALAKLTSSGLPAELVDQLAQAGPEALGLAEALTTVDQDKVAALLAELDATGTEVADVFTARNAAALTAQAQAENPLPAMQSFNSLLREETQLWQQGLRERERALEWAESMADEYLPPLNYEWQTLDEMLADEIAKQQQANKDRKKAQDWAEGMTATTIPALVVQTQAITAAVNKEAAAYRALAAAMAAAGASTGTTAARSYDSGGYLPVGLSLAYNGTGRPEPVGHGLGGVTVQSGAIVVRIDAAPGTDLAGVRRSAEDGIASGLGRVLAGLEGGVR